MGTKMKAVVYTEYGPPEVLRVTEVDKPTPKDNEVLVRVHAAAVNIGDIMGRTFNQITPRTFSMPSPLWLPARLDFGLNKPRKHILGSEFSGEVEAIGQAVTQFKVGDAVFGYLAQGMGAYAEYVCMPESGKITAKPANMTYEEAAAVPYGMLTALNLLRKVNVQSGQKVLINGASGGIGAAAVQLAKRSGAEVTGVCGTPRVPMVKALGADKVIDYKREDFTTNGETYDLVFDILGKSGFARCKNSLTPNGTYMLASFKMKHLFQMISTRLRGGKRVRCALSLDKPQDLVTIRDMAEAGEIKAIVDRCFPLEQAAEAHRYYESGSKTGSVIITMVPGSSS